MAASESTAFVAGRWEFGKGLRLNACLYGLVSYRSVMTETDGARQHTSADVAPELYEPEEDR
jgi:hypothetical protein